MFIADFLPPRPDRRWDYARQLGVRHAIVKLHPEVTGRPPPSDIRVLREVKERFAEGGFQLYGLEGDPMDMSRIKLGLPGRDEDIEAYQKILRNLGELGIPLLCYNFMAGIGWFRTATNLPERGGALVSGYDAKIAAAMPLTEVGEVSEERVFANYRYFIEAVLPVAEESGVRMGLHPDDPPVSPLRGIGRFLRNADGFRRAFALSGSPSHGMTFCQGSLAAAGEDLPTLAREFADRIVFLHFRDVVGTSERFRETFHDNGPTDMAAMIRLYHELELDVPIRVDHVPTLVGEENLEPGYAALGRLYAIGYLRGLIEGTS